MKLISLVILLFSINSFADSPDDKFEKLIYTLYQKYYSKPISSVEWQEYIKNVKEEKYTVKSGDTLWVLSKIFFADPLFWSKIWALNGELTNPHVISVGKELRFLQGTENEPPSMLVTNQNNAVPAPLAKISPSDDDNVDKSKIKNIEIPENQSRLNPLLRVLPSSFRESNDAYLFSQKEFIADLRPKPMITHEVEVLSFPSADDLSTQGDVIGILGVEGGIALREQEVLLRLPKDTTLGSVVYGVTKIYNLNSEKFEGYSFNYCAKLRVIEFTPEGYVRAKVEHSYWPIKAGDKIIQTPPAIARISAGGNVVKGNWHVLAGAESKERKQFSFNELVYLDAGSNEGLSHGNLVEVYQKIDLPDEGPVYAPSPKAVVQIVNVLPEISSGLIIRNNMPINSGDRTSRTVKE